MPKETTKPGVLTDLVPEMQDKAQKVIELCANAGVQLLIYCTYRRLQEQARLYCNGHPKDVCGKKAHYLRYVKQLPELAAMLEAEIEVDVDADDKPPTTKGAPGESFHAFGMAFDAVPLIGGKTADWNVKSKAWRTYSDALAAVGLFWAGDWPRFVEFPHAQLVQEPNPLKHFSRDALLASLRENGAL